MQVIPSNPITAAPTSRPAFSNITTAAPTGRPAFSNWTTASPSSLSTPGCQDDKSWRDSKTGSNCSEWIGFDCSQAFKGYDHPDVVMKHCKATCKLCGTSLHVEHRVLGYDGIIGARSFFKNLFGFANATGANGSFSSFRSCIGCHGSIPIMRRY